MTRSSSSPVTEPVLSTCPFCGGEMMFRKTLWPSDGNVDSIIHDHPADCGLVEFSDGTTDESIIGRWNTRASQPATPTGGEVVAWSMEKALTDKDAERVNAILAAPPPSSAATVAVPVDAIVNLVNHQQQCDMDGVMVQVSRQALCEVLAYVTEVRPDNKWADGVAQPKLDPDLVQRCEELLEWGKTGLLAGGKGGSVRALAEKLQEKVGNHYALTVAESQTKDDAMRAIIGLASSIPSTTRKAPASCPDCYDETDCANVDICVALTSPPRETPHDH